MAKPSYKKAEWIAKRMDEGTNPDDVLDVLLGNINEPTRFVAEVSVLSTEYDDELEANTPRRRNV